MSDIFTIPASPLFHAGASKLSSIVALCMLAAACSDQSVSTDLVTPSVSKAAIGSAATQRVVLAHQSVGMSILEGAQVIATTAGVQLQVVETREPPLGGAGIYHFNVGTNGDPVGKIEDFKHTIASGAFNDFDLALMKLCYVDFEANIDVAGIAARYVDTLTELQRTFPQVRFVAVTAPLTTVQDGPKAWIKQALGRPPYGFAENRRRQEFNDVLRRRFPPHNLFDLAQLEATTQLVTFQGESLQTLDPTITADGGHLNGRGQQILGDALLRFIAATGSVR